MSSPPSWCQTAASHYNWRVIQVCFHSQSWCAGLKTNHGRYSKPTQWQYLISSAAFLGRQKTWLTASRLSGMRINRLI